MRTAAAVRMRKEQHPEEYCRVPSCLWKTGGSGGKPCRKHPVRVRCADSEPAHDVGGCPTCAPVGAEPGVST